jgi:hypothetical protein
MADCEMLLLVKVALVYLLLSTTRAAALPISTWRSLSGFVPPAQKTERNALRV